MKYLNVPAGMLVTGDIPDMIRLKIRGSKMRLAKINEEFFAPYQINLEGATTGKNIYRIYSDDFKVPFGVNVDRVQPAAINVTLDKSIFKTITINPNITGAPAPGYVFKIARVKPSEVQIQSYAALLNQVDSLGTEEINLSGRHKSFEGDYKVDTKGFNVSLLNQTVHVSVEIDEKKGSDTVLSVPIRWQDSDAVLMNRAGGKIQPDTVSIKITGATSKVFDLVKNPPTPGLNRKEFLASLKQRKDASIHVELPPIDGIDFEVEPSTVKLIYAPRKK